MADGKTHTKATIMTSIAMTVFGAGMGYELRAVKWSTGGMIGVVIMSDLDHKAITEAEQIMLGISPIVGRAFILYWTPYQKIFKHYVGNASHIPIIGTGTRLIYIAVTLIPLLLLGFDLLWLVDWDIISGLVVVDTIHWLLDLGKND